MVAGRITTLLRIFLRYSVGMADEELKQTSEQQPAKIPIGLKIGLALSGIAVLGQYAGMFIMAAAGRDQLEFALFGSILWTSLLFYFMYRIGGRKGSTGVWVGVAVGVMASFIAGFISGYIGARNEKLAEVDTAISDLNRDLPKLIDDVTRLESYESEGDDVLVMNFTLIGPPLDETEIEQWKVDVLEPGIQTACNDANTRNALNLGVVYESRYRDEAGKLVMSFQIDKASCK